MNRTSFVTMATAAVLFLTAWMPAAAQSQQGLDRSAARISRAAPGLPLAAAAQTTPEAMVTGYLAGRGRSAARLK